MKPISEKELEQVVGSGGGFKPGTPLTTKKPRDLPRPAGTTPHDG